MTTSGYKTYSKRYLEFNRYKKLKINEVSFKLDYTEDDFRKAFGVPKYAYTLIRCQYNAYVKNMRNRECLEIYEETYLKTMRNKEEWYFLQGGNDKVHIEEFENYKDIFFHEYTKSLEELRDRNNQSKQVELRNAIR